MYLLFALALLNCHLQIKDCDALCKYAENSISLTGTVISIPTTNTDDRTKFYFSSETVCADNKKPQEIKARSIVTIYGQPDSLSKIKIGDKLKLNGFLALPFEAQNPSQFDVLVLPNLYGDIVSDLTAGLIGGLGVAQGANIGTDCAVFEPVHGSAPDIKGQNRANPTALLICAVNMLKHINENETAEKIERALYKVIEEGKVLTPDLGGNATTTEYTQEIIKNL